MKTIHFLFLLGLLFTAHNSKAGGCVGTVPVAPPAPEHARPHKCVVVTQLAPAAVNPEEGRRLEEELRGLGKSKIKENCSFAPSNEKIEITSSVHRSICGQVEKEQHICHYVADLDCKYKDKNFPMLVGGACISADPNCGNFRDCLADERLTTKFIKFKIPQGTEFKVDATVNPGGVQK